MDFKTKISTKKSARRSTVDISTAFRRLKKLRFPYKLDKWVPHSLREQDKSDSVSVANSMRLYYKKMPYLDTYFTSDEKWLVYYNVRGNQRWKQHFEYIWNVAKTDLHERDVFREIEKG